MRLPAGFFYARMGLVNWPRIDWKNSNTPYSVEFDDVYFNPQNGLRETEVVYLEQNCLRERFLEKKDKKINNGDSSPFVVAELGFGTGLNFIATWKMYNELKCSFPLVFYSCEKYPLKRAELLTALRAWDSNWNSDAGEVEGLLEMYPELIPGYHSLELVSSRNSGSLRLDLFIGEVSDAIRAFSGTVDAWFLDGFAPSKNPQMWTDEVLELISEKSQIGTTFGTFTSVGRIRRKLESLGFVVTKSKGPFGYKEISRGEMTELIVNIGHSTIPSWYRIAQSSVPKSVAVIGAGISGASIANRLINRGLEVTLFEAENEIAAGASGNPLGLMMPVFAKEKIPLADFSLAAYLNAQNLLKSIAKAFEWEADGILKFPHSEKELRKIKSYVEIYDPRAIFTNFNGTILKLLDGVRLNPRQFVQYLITEATDCGLIFLKNQNIRSMKKIGEYWSLSNAEGVPVGMFDSVVLANAYAVKEFAASSWLPMTQVRGQITELELNESLPSKSISYDGYFAPSFSGTGFVGATYDRIDPNSKILESESTELVDRLVAVLENSDGLPKTVVKRPSILGARVGIRASTSDHFPIVGPVPDAREFCSDYRDLDQGRPESEYADTLPRNTGLYVLTGMGSRGLTYAPYCARILEAQMFNEPLPIDSNLISRILPARFLVRHLRRKLGQAPDRGDRNQRLNLI